jgi:hypothetical protein
MRLLLLPLLITMSCSHDKAEDFAWAVTPATYDVSAPVCASSDAAPSYADSSYQANLYVFDAPTTHTLDIDGSHAVETLADADCTVTIQRHVYQNGNGELTLSLQRRHEFTPADCTLQMTWRGRTFDLGATSGDVFADSDDTAAEIPWVPTAVSTDTDPAGGYELLTRDDPHLDDLWATYGCPKADRLRRRLTPQAH